MFLSVGPQPVMKNALRLSALLLFSISLFTGCERHSLKSTATEVPKELGTDELARLLDLHTLKVSIPQSQRPFSQIQVVLVRPDGTNVQISGRIGCRAD